MSSGFMLSLIILAVVSASLYFIVQAEGGVGELPRLLDRVGVPLPSVSLPTLSTPAVSPRAPSDFTSGNSRFSQGSCLRDSDCTISGCSGEVCGSREAITTCEFSDSFPSAQEYSCGCVKSVCGWQEK